MINYNSGINIANYNSNGTGNLSLYCASNDMYIATGAGRDININGGRYVSVNAAQPDGAFLVYTSTMNTTTLQDTNITANRNMTLRADQPGNSVTLIASTISLLAASAINLSGTTSLNSNLNMNNHTIYNAFELYNNNTDLLLTGIGRNITLQTISGTDITLNSSSNININSVIDTNITAQKNMVLSASNSGNYITLNSGEVNRTLSGTSISQPVIQYNTISTSGNNGSQTVALPTPYTSGTSFVAFACMEDADPAEISVVRDNLSSITIHWAQAGGGSHTIAWNTMGI
jgi:uncharacterized protein (DUF2345 family)